MAFDATVGVFKPIERISMSMEFERVVFLKINVRNAQVKMAAAGGQESPVALATCSAASLTCAGDSLGHPGWIHTPGTLPGAILAK